MGADQEEFYFCGDWQEPDGVNLSSAFKKFIYLIVVNFHVNAAVERGFSMKKNCLAENLQEESLIAWRTVSEQAKFAGGSEKVTLDHLLLLSCENASARWRDVLKRKRDEKGDTNNKEAKKCMLQNEIWL